MPKVREPMLSPREAAQRLGVTLDWIYRELWSNRLPGRRQGAKWLIPASAVGGRLREREKRDGTTGR